MGERAAETAVGILERPITGRESKTREDYCEINEL